MKYFGATDTGKVRKINQDSYVIATSSAGELLAIVCDGVCCRIAHNFFFFL